MNINNELLLREKTVKQYIKLRKELGYSQQDVANIMGVSKQLISRFERMENSPTLSFLVGYANALNANIDTILSFTESININDDYDAEVSIETQKEIDDK